MLSGPVRTPALIGDGMLLATGSDGDPVRLWDVPDYEERAVLWMHGDHVLSMALAGSHLATGGQDRLVKVHALG